MPRPCPVARAGSTTRSHLCSHTAPPDRGDSSGLHRCGHLRGNVRERPNAGITAHPDQAPPPAGRPLPPLQPGQCSPRSRVIPTGGIALRQQGVQAGRTEWKWAGGAGQERSPPPFWPSCGVFIRVDLCTDRRCDVRSDVDPRQCGRCSNDTDLDPVMGWTVAETRGHGACLSDRAEQLARPQRFPRVMCTVPPVRRITGGVPADEMGTD